MVVSLKSRPTDCRVRKLQASVPHSLALKTNYLSLQPEVHFRHSYNDDGVKFIKFDSAQHLIVDDYLDVFVHGRGK